MTYNDDDPDNEYPKWEKQRREEREAHQKLIDLLRSVKPDDLPRYHGEVLAALDALESLLE